MIAANERSRAVGVFSKRSSFYLQSWFSHFKGSAYKCLVRECIIRGFKYDCLGDKALMLACIICIKTIKLLLFRVALHLPELKAGVSKRLCQGAARATTQHFKDRTSFENMIVAKYVTVYQNNKCFVNILFFNYWQNALRLDEMAWWARWKGFAGHILPSGRSMENPGLLKERFHEMEKIWKT